MAHIYKIINVVTDEFYIGSSVKFKKRKWEHLNALKKQTHHCAKLQAAWDVYGADAFEFELLEEVADEDAFRIEDTYLLLYAGRTDCYNTLTTTTQSPGVERQESRDKISIALQNLYKGGVYTPRVGKTHSQETKERIRAAKLENPTRYWLGKKRSEETKKKVGDAQRGVAKPSRTYTQSGLERVRENMKRNAIPQLPKGFEEVYAKFPVEVQERYDFSNAKYTGALKRIMGCFCEQHGIFSQYAAQFRKGRGCPECGAEQRAESKRQQMKEFWKTNEGRTLFIESRKNSLTPPKNSV